MKPYDELLIQIPKEAWQYVEAEFEESEDGEGDSNKLHDYREKVNVLNSDLHEIIDHGEGEGEGEYEGISINEDTT